MATTRPLPRTFTEATEEDLLNTADDGRKYELVDGEIRSLSPAGYAHGQICLRLGGRLLAFVSERQLGDVLEGQTGFRLPARKGRKNIRSPDLSFVAAGRVPSGTEDFADVAPDLAVEVLSPSDRPRYVLDKVGELLEAGTRVVWIIDPKRRIATVYRSISEVEVISESGSLDGGEVIPGFTCPLADILP